MSRSGMKTALHAIAYFVGGTLACAAIFGIPLWLLTLHGGSAGYP